MKELLVKRGDKPSYSRMMRRDRRIASNQPLPGYGLMMRETEDGTWIELAGSDTWPHPWRVNAVGVAVTPALVLLRIEPGTVTINGDAEEPILAANNRQVPPPPGEVWRDADVALSDAGRWSLHMEAAAMPVAREIGRGLPEAVYNMARATPVPGAERTARVAEVGLLADPMRPRGRRFTANVVGDPPRADLSALDRGVFEFFKLDQITPVLATWITLAEVWALAPMDEPTQRDFGPGWTVVVRQLECWDLNFGLLPMKSSTTEQPLVDPALRWFLGRYTQAPAATIDGYQANQQIALAYAENAPPVAAWWT